MRIGASAVCRLSSSTGNTNMRHSVVAALGAALIAGAWRELRCASEHRRLRRYRVRQFDHLQRHVLGSVDLARSRSGVVAGNGGQPRRLFRAGALRSKSCLPQFPRRRAASSSMEIRRLCPRGPAARGRRHPVVDSWGRAKQGYVHRNADYGAVDQSGDNRRNRPATVGNAQRHRAAASRIRQFCSR